MASELYVETLKGLTSGANANKVIVPSGQTLYAPGHVLQVVQADTSTTVTNTTTSFTDTGLIATITPISASSKILVTVNQQTRLVRSSSSQYGGIRLVRNGSVILAPVTDGTGPFELAVETGGTNAGINTRYSIVYFDNPSTTSSITYKTQGRPYFTNSSGSMTFQSSSVVNGKSTITLIEVAG